MCIQILNTSLYALCLNRHLMLCLNSASCMASDLLNRCLLCITVRTFPYFNRLTHLPSGFHHGIKECVLTQCMGGDRPPMTTAEKLISSIRDLFVSRNIILTKCNMCQRSYSLQLTQWCLRNPVVKGEDTSINLTDTNGVTGYCVQDTPLHCKLCFLSLI